MTINKKTISKYVFLSTFSLFVSGINLYVGVTLKPYMFLLIFGSVLFVNNGKISKISDYEFLMLIFFSISSLTLFQFRYPSENIKFFLAIILITFFYFVNKELFQLLTYIDLKKIYSFVFFCGIIASLIYYVIGCLKLNFHFSGNKVFSYGVMLDRNMPRLIGLTGNDPNIFVFIWTFPLFYTLCNFSNVINKITFSFIILAILLTFSRGGYLGIIIGVVYLIMKNKKISILLSIIFIVCMANMISINYLNLDIFNLFFDRTEIAISDQGSGRLDLWRLALQNFSKHPLFGIGINSTLSYARDIGSFVIKYTHNTYLEVLTETGLIGFSSFVLFLLTIGNTIKKISFFNYKTFIFAAYISMLVQMMFLSILYNEAFYFFLINISYFFNISTFKDEEMREC